MKKFLTKLKKDLKENWIFYLVEVLALLIFEFGVLKIEPIKAVVIAFLLVFASLVLVVVFGIREISKN